MLARSHVPVLAQVIVPISKLGNANIGITYYVAIVKYYIQSHYIWVSYKCPYCNRLPSASGCETGASGWWLQESVRSSSSFDVFADGVGYPVISVVFLGGAKQVREAQGVGFVVSQCSIDLRKQVRTIAFKDCTMQQVVFESKSNTEPCCAYIPKIDRR